MRLVDGFLHHVWYMSNTLRGKDKVITLSGIIEVRSLRNIYDVALTIQYNTKFIYLFSRKYKQYNISYE